MPWGGNYVSILKQYYDILLYIDKAMRAPILNNSKTHSDVDIPLTDLWKFKGWICFDFVFGFIYVIILSFQISAAQAYFAAVTSLILIWGFESHTKCQLYLILLLRTGFTWVQFHLNHYMMKLEEGRILWTSAINTTCWVEEVWFVKQKTCSLLTDDFGNWNPSWIQMF